MNAIKKIELKQKFIPSTKYRKKYSILDNLYTVYLCTFTFPINV